MIKWHLIFLTGIFLLVNGVLFLKMGIMVDDDTEHYLTYARELNEFGFFFKPHYFWYLGYVGFLWGIMKIHPSFEAVVLVQYLLSYLAMISLYRSGIRLSGKPLVGWVTCMCFMGFFMTQFWNLFLYAESMLISMTCFSIYFVLKWDKNELPVWQIPLMALVIAITFFTKPTGIAMLGAFTLFAVLKLGSQIKSKKIRWILAASLLAMGVVLLNSMLNTFGFVNDYLSGEIVYNISKLSDQDYARYLIVERPASLWLPDENHPALARFFTLIFMNPWYSIQLIGTKLFFFLFYVRPYYSWLHNALALLVLVPMYVFFVKGLWRRDFGSDFKVFSLVYFLITTLSTVLLTIDWNSRFLMPLLPLVFLVGSGEMVKFLSEKRFQ